MAQVLLVSTYELGRQPFGLASPAAWLRRAGHDVVTIDASRTRVGDEAIAAAEVVGFYLPMHTATRLARPLIARVRRLNPRAHLCAYGLYAPLNDELLRAAGVETVLGPEFEQELVDVVDADRADRAGRVDGAERAGRAGRAEGAGRAAALPRLPFIQPDRRGLPPLGQYASLQLPDGTRRVVGTTEATRGCKHLCRHCPIVPVYNGQFRVVPADVVLADVRAQVAGGARHITFADPDFFNGPTHAVRIVRALAAECPGVSYDVTIKVEHLLKHRDLLPVLVETGCAFVTSAVEAVDDAILARLEKGHTRADFVEAVAACRAAGLAMVPTFVAFTPWTTVDGYLDLLHTLVALDLVDHVAPIQLAIRLLVTSGSRLLELADMRALVGEFDAASLTYPWAHPDPRADALQRAITELVGVRLNAPRREIFEAVWQLAHAHAGRTAGAATGPARDRATVPYLNEPWYC